MQLLAEIASGETDTADIFFLLAVIAAVLSVVSAYIVDAARHTVPLLAAAVALASFAWLVL